MVSKSVKVNLSQDAEARPVAVLVQIASRYESRVNILSGSKKVNAKSIMGMMSLGFTNGSDVSVEADGADEETALSEITKYIASEA